MQIVEPYAKPLNLPDRQAGIEMLKRIESYARVSHRSEERQTDSTWERFIKAVVMDKGDMSVLEHESVTCECLVDRGVSHEWVRHRIGAYTQESTRFVNYGKMFGLQFIEPAGIRESEFEAAWLDGMRTSSIAYTKMLESGATPQQARSVLPNALATKLIVTYNLRSWRQFFMMRTTRETHPDFRRIASGLLSVFKERVPLIYDDLVTEEKQSISLSKPR